MVCGWLMKDHFGGVVLLFRADTSSGSSTRCRRQSVSESETRTDVAPLLSSRSGWAVTVPPLIQERPGRQTPSLRNDVYGPGCTLFTSEWSSRCTCPPQFLAVRLSHCPPWWYPGQMGRISDHLRTLYESGAHSLVSPVTPPSIHCPICPISKKSK